MSVIILHKTPKFEVTYYIWCDVCESLVDEEHKHRNRLRSRGLLPNKKNKAI
jgi:hypothetical protein